MKLVETGQVNFMEESQKRSLSTIFPVPTNTINGIKFSSREIDVLACVIGGRTAKKIASFLSLSPRTVENYIHNITLKLECNSRESLIDFVERSDKLFIVKEHYSDLLIQAEFEKSLREILKLNRKKSLSFLLVYWEETALRKSFIHSLQKHLKLAGLAISVEVQKEFKLFSQDTLEFPGVDYVICVVSQSILEELQKEKEPKLSLSQKTAQPKKNILFLLLERRNSVNVSRKLMDFGTLDVIEEQNYYFLIFEALTKLLPNFDFEKIILEFKERYENINNSHRGIYPQISLERQKLENNENIAKHKISQFLKKRKWYFLLAIFSVGLLSVGLISMSRNTERKGSMREYHIQAKNQEANSIRSDLILPAEAIFLDRPELMTQIEEKLNGQDNIQTVALVGVGGAGKTTLARNYARSHPTSLIWELNAETRESLVNSFEDLAQALSKTEEDKKVFSELQEIKNQGKRENKILLFVKERLKIHLNWFLIYDNVEKFTDIQKYFPQEVGTWGKGKVILTTRDSNIQNNKHVNYAVSIEILNAQQKLDLFTKIVSGGSIKSITLTQNEENKKFLEAIPPFPLDVSIAAYYLKATNISYRKYLKNLDKNNKEFVTLQENILKDLGDYINTRYSIITLSLQRLINTHKDFEDLLLFISLLDSQNIPRELLEKYKEEAVVDNFIYNLKKYSLIINDSASFLSGTTFSIHRSTREISLAYLIKTLNLEENNQLLQPIADISVNYFSELIDKADVPRMKLCIPHGEIFLSQDKLLNDAMKASIRGELGRIYHALGYFIKAKSLFEETIMDSNKNNNNRIYIARALTQLGEIYRDLGDYKKAKDLLQESIIIYKNYFPENHMDIAYALLYSGFVYANLGDWEKAKNLLEECLIIYKNYFPENYAYGTRVLANLGNIYKALGNYKEAKNLLEQNLIICKKHLPKNHVELAQTLAYLGVINGEIGHVEEAKNLLEQSLVICKTHVSENHLWTAQVATYLGDAYIELGHYAKAKALLEQSLKVFQQYYPEKHIFNARVLINLGKIYTKLNDYKNAKCLFEKSLIFYENHYGKDHIETAWALRYLGQLYLHENHLKEAEDIFSNVLTILQKNNHPRMYFIYEDFADLCYQKSLLAQNEEKKEIADSLQAQAVVYLKKAHQGMTAHFPEISSYLKRIQSKLKNIQ